MIDLYKQSDEWKAGYNQAMHDIATDILATLKSLPPDRAAAHIMGALEVLVKRDYIRRDVSAGEKGNERNGKGKGNCNHREHDGGRNSESCLYLQI